MRSPIPPARVIVALVLIGCHAAPPASSGPAPSLDAPAPIRRCNATVPGADVSRWREVRAAAFTFCVPDGWSGDGRSWATADSRIQWGRGTPPAARVRVEMVPFASAQEVGAGPAASTGAGEVGPSGAPLRPDMGADQFEETINGALATMSRRRTERAVFTSARWAGMNVYLSGEARDGPGAAVQLLIFRTVRFTAG
jgi:hypothetical protein